MNEERKSRFRGRCVICLSNKHLFRQCLSEKTCFYCKRKRNHHSALCPVNFGGEREDEKEEELIEVGEQMEFIGKLEVIMKTAKVEIINLKTKKSKIITALLD